MKSHQFESLKLHEELIEWQYDLKSKNWKGLCNMPGKTSNTDFKYRTNQTEAARPELQRFTVMLYCFQGHIIVFFSPRNSGGCGRKYIYRAELLAGHSWPWVLSPDNPSKIFLWLEFGVSIWYRRCKSNPPLFLPRGHILTLAKFKCTFKLQSSIIITKLSKIETIIGQNVLCKNKKGQ